MMIKRALSTTTQEYYYYSSLSYDWIHFSTILLGVLTPLQGLNRPVNETFNQFI